MSGVTKLAKSVLGLADNSSHPSPTKSKELFLSLYMPTIAPSSASHHAWRAGVELVREHERFLVQLFEAIRVRRGAVGRRVGL